MGIRKLAALNCTQSTHRKHMRCVESLMNALSRRCSAIGAVAGHCGTSAEMSRPKDRCVRAYGPNCLGIRTGQSQCRNVFVHWCRSISGPNCLGSDVSVSPGSPSTSLLLLFSRLPYLPLPSCLLPPFSFFSLPFSFPLSVPFLPLPPVSSPFPVLYGVGHVSFSAAGR